MSMQLTCMFASASPHPSHAASWNALHPSYVAVQSYRTHSSLLAIHARTSSQREGPLTRILRCSSNAAGGRPHWRFSRTSMSCAWSSRSANVERRLVLAPRAARSSPSSEGSGSVTRSSGIGTSANSPVRGSSTSGSSTTCSGGVSSASGSVIHGSSSPSTSSIGFGAGAFPPPGSDDISSPPVGGRALRRCEILPRGEFSRHLFC